MDSSNGTAGAVLLSLTFGTFLGGVSTVQAIIFLRMNRKDPLLHKIAVTALWLLGMLQLSFITHSTHRAITAPLSRVPFEIPWSFKIQLFMMCIIAFVTKILYTLRIWRLCPWNRRIIPIMIFVILIVEYVFGTLAGYRFWKISALSKSPDHTLRWTVLTALSLMCVTDVLTATVLAFFLVQRIRNLGWTSSELVMFSAYIINTGAVTSLFSLISLVAFARSPGNDIPLAIELLLPQLHANCFLAMMNARCYFQFSDIKRAILGSEVPTRNPSSPPTRQESVTIAGAASAESVGENELTHDQKEMTINEMGLPLVLFPSPMGIRRKESNEHAKKPDIPMEVFVQTRQEQHTGWLPTRFHPRDRVSSSSQSSFV